MNLIRPQSQGVYTHSLIIGVSVMGACLHVQAEAQSSIEQKANSSRAQTQSSPITFRLATDQLPPGNIQLANGIVVAASDWPTLILAQIPKHGPSNSRASTCTGTLIGPKVVLTAAHCVDDPLLLGTKKVELEIDSLILGLTCEIHPDYRKRDSRFNSPRGSEDYALCLLDDVGRPIGSLAAMRFEVVEATQNLKTKEPVLMTGYGCSELKIDNGWLTWKQSAEDFRRLRIGDGLIDSAASGVPPDPTYVMVRSAGGREPALCPGDSGGPLFTGASTGNPNIGRRLRGVNSAVSTLRRKDGQHDIVSFIAETGTPIFRNWANEWVTRKNHPIVCGLNRNPGDTPCLD